MFQKNNQSRFCFIYAHRLKTCLPDDPSGALKAVGEPVRPHWLVFIWVGGGSNPQHAAPCTSVCVCASAGRRWPAVTTSDRWKRHTGIATSQLFLITSASGGQAGVSDYKVSAGFECESEFTAQNYSFTLWQTVLCLFTFSANMAAPSEIMNKTVELIQEEEIVHLLLRKTEEDDQFFQLTH